MSEAPKWAVHAPQAEPQSVPQTPKASATHAEGSATIKAGESLVGVTHGLAGSPNIVLRFDDTLPPDNFSYVVMAGKTFQVNLSAPVKEDTTFTWTADT